MAFTWAFDLDGVIWTGNRVVPGSPEAVAALQATGDNVIFVTNNSASTVAEQEAKLAGFGIDASGSVVTSAMAAATLVQDGESVYVLGGPGVIESVESAGARVCDVDPAEFVVDVVVVGLDRELSYERMARAALHIRGGARFVATNDDASFPAERGLLPGAGALVAALATTTGQKPMIAGKPYPAICGLVKDQFGPVGIVIGDRHDTDGRFAAALGYEFALVLSGVTTSAAGLIDPVPAHVAANACELVQRLIG